MPERKERAAALVEEFLQAGQEIPFSPEVGTKLVDLASKPVEMVEIDQLVRLLETDAGFAGKILQLANSSYFAGVEKIVSLRRAITQIGMEETINFMHMAYYRTVLPSLPTLDGFLSDQDYWRYSWATAFAGKILGHPRVGGTVLPGELYIAGLLHGVGRVVLAFNKPVDIMKALQKAEHFSQSVEEVQLAVFGTTDLDISRELLSRWQLPDNVCRAVGHLRHPENASTDIQEFAGLLQLACYIAKSSGAGSIAFDGCDEVGQTWVATSSDMPLANPNVLSKHVEEIGDALQNKKRIFDEGEKKQGKKKVKKSSAAPSPEPPAPQKRKGLFQRIFGWLMELL